MILRCIASSVWLLILAIAQTAAQGVIEGRVALPATRTAPVVTKRYEIVTKGGVIATSPPVAVVYLEGNFAKPYALPTKQITQKDLTFSPALLPIRTGTTIEFPNLDDTYHNIFSYSPAKRFDLGRYRPEERPIPSQVFNSPGLVTLRCDIHEHMRALILVLDTPHFVTSDTKGAYRLTGIAPGHYTLKAWVNSRTIHSRAVDLKAGETLHIDLP